MNSRIRRWGIWLVVLFAYIVVAVGMTWPVTKQISTHLVGTGDDMWVQYWNNWWVKSVLTDGGDVYATLLLFHPQTTSLVYHNFSWVNIAGWLVIEPILGGITTYNLIYLAHIVLCAWSMFFLVRYLVGSTGPAFVAGLIYGCWPYRLSDYNHPNTISMEWLPLALLCTIWMARNRKQIRYGILTGIFVALTGLSRWQMLLPVAIVLGGYLLFSVLFEREFWSRYTLSALILATLVAGLLIAIPFYPLINGLFTNNGNDDLHVDLEAEKQTDLIAYLVPPVNHPMAFLFTGLDYTRSPVHFRYSAFLGYSVLVLAIVAMLRCRQELWFWGVLTLVALALTSGPVLRVNGRFYPDIPMPYRLVGWSLPMRLMRNPHRFNVLLALPVAVLAGYGVSVLEGRLTRLRSAWLWGFFSILVLFEYFNLPAANVLATAPKFYQVLAQDQADFAVLDLPMGRDHGDDYMFYQTVHGHPILEGNTARPQPEMFAFINTTPLLRALREDRETELLFTDISRQLATLAEAQVDYIVIHKPFVDSNQLEAWRTFFFFNPVYEDEQVLVYRTTLEYGRDLDLATELSDNLGIVSSSLSAPVLAQNGLLEVNLYWGTHTAPTRDWIAQLTLVAQNGKAVQTVETDLCAGWPTSEWGESALVRGRIELQLDPFIKGGLYTVMVGLVDLTSRNLARENAALGQVQVQAAERIFELPSITETSQVVFGNVLELLGYDLYQDDQELLLTLHWRALRRMDTSYKIFIHMIDSESGELTAQKDVVPRNWTYPTHWWEANEIVSDKVSIPLADVPTGTYNLVIGVYNPTSLDRLMTSISSDQIVLVEMIDIFGSNK